MAVGYDTSATGQGTAVSSLSVPISVASNIDRYLVVHIETGDIGATISSVTFNSASMSQLYTAATDTNTIWAYGLANPAAVTADVVVTFAAAPSRCSVIASSFFNVAQTNSTGTPQTVADSVGADTFFVSCDGGTEGDLAIGFGSRETSAGAIATIASVDGIPKFVASGALSTATAQTSRTPALPANLQMGDLLLAHCASENNATHSCATSGWNKLGQTNSGALWTVSHWWAIQTAAGLAAPTITWTGSVDASARTHALRDTKADGTPCAYLGTVGAGTGATHTSTGANTGSADSRVAYVDHASANTALATPAGWTENTDSGSTTGPVRTVFGGKDVATAGTGSGNISVAGAAAAWVQQQIECFHADNGDQTERAQIVHSGQNEVCAVATEPADAFNTFGWVCTGGAVTATASGAFVLRASKSLLAGFNQSRPFLTR